MSSCFIFDPAFGNPVLSLLLNLLNTERDQKMEVEARNEVTESLKLAKTDPELPVAAMFDDVYSQMPRDFSIRTCDPFVSVPGTLSAK